jgi:hypothetical protein
VRRRTRGSDEPNLFKTLKLDFGFSCARKPIQFSFLLSKQFKVLIPVLVVSSHMGENLKTHFQPGFHPK